MSKIADANWAGQSGTKYAFQIYPLNTTFKPLGAVYVISKRTPKPNGGANHTFIYIGQTGDLSTRFDDHHKEACFATHGANCISVHLNNSSTRRFEIETDLCREHDPPCNG
jgi:hypothetical protein